MKMICPHCGVKGSAEDALLGRKVKCPKCIGIFEVQAEVVEAIEVGELDLEQLPDEPSEQFDATSEKEVEDVFSKLLAGDTVAEATESAENDIDALLNVEEKDADQGGAVAALSSLEDDTSGENELVDEDEDETLTIIEDFPEEVMIDSDDAQADAAEYEEEIASALDGIDDDDLQENTIEEKETEEAEEALDFEEGFLDDIEEEPQPDHPEEERESDDDLPDELFADESQIEKDTAEETETVGDIFETDEPEEDDEIRLDEEESTDSDENILSASFLDNNLDEQLEQEEDEQAARPIVQKCSACDQYVDPENKYESGDNVYCSKCRPTDIEIIEEDIQEDEELTGDGESAFPGLSGKVESQEADSAKTADDGAVGRFTIATLIKDAWHYSKGVKGSIWAGIAVMYIVLFGLAFSIVFLNMKVLPALKPIQGMMVDGAVQAVVSFLSYVFSAGILMIAVNRVGHQHFSWKMVFSGFKHIGSMIVLAILQTIMLIIGFCLFIIPGIYLSVGYILAIPLIFVKGLSPWQALETSRQAIHKRWWTVFFALIVMSILVSISAIPLGLGLIWTVPMFAVMIGVLFYHLCGVDDEEEVFE